MKLVADILGHAAESFTSDVYAVVAKELAGQAAVAVAAFVPPGTMAGLAGGMGSDKEISSS